MMIIRMHTHTCSISPSLIAGYTTVSNQSLGRQSLGMSHSMYMYVIALNVT